MRKQLRKASNSALIHAPRTCLTHSLLFKHMLLLAGVSQSKQPERLALGRIPIWCFGSTRIARSQAGFLRADSLRKERSSHFPKEYLQLTVLTTAWLTLVCSLQSYLSLKLGILSLPSEVILLASLSIRNLPQG